MAGQREMITDSSSPRFSLTSHAAVPADEEGVARACWPCLQGIAPVPLQFPGRAERSGDTSDGALCRRLPWGGQSGGTAPTDSGDRDTAAGRNTDSGDCDTAAGRNTAGGDCDTATGRSTSRGDCDTMQGSNTTGDCYTVAGRSTTSGDCDAPDQPSAVVP